MRRISSTIFPWRRRRVPLLLAGALLLTAATLAATALPRQGRAEAPLAMPEFKHQQPAAWLNSPPLSRADLRGQVVLIEIWTSV